MVDTMKPIKPLGNIGLLLLTTFPAMNQVTKEVTS